MLHRALHVSDLHTGRRETPGLPAALAELAAALDPELVIATGDLAHRGRRDQLERARALLDGLGAPVLAVPGNHDLPYALPARFTRPRSSFEHVFGTASPVHRSPALVAVGLDSTQPWRQQGGRLTWAQLGRVLQLLRTAPPGALRLVACHHHLAGAPWRARHKRPLARRDRVLAGLALAGVELAVGGHVHQGSAAERHEFEALEGSRPGSLVVATAPGLGRPRPYLRGEAQGLHVYEWDEELLAVLTYVWDGAALERTARREFPRAPWGTSARSE